MLPWRPGAICSTVRENMKHCGGQSLPINELQKEIKHSVLSFFKPAPNYSITGRSEELNTVVFNSDVNKA